ncbi:MAG: hypothetical protein QF582_15315 [Alphaproteobacteria bacterium]|jgi:hypothetical protein|nr:hypothetical protein [Alphaproteobacteria bacterium]
MNQGDLFTIVSPQLRRGERAVWVERPAPMARAFSRIALFLFGIPFFGFAVFWTGMAAQSGQVFFPLFGIPFMLVGAGLLLSPIWSYVEARNWLVYAITDQRLLIIRTFPRHKIESWEPADISKLERTAKPDGSGTILFADEVRQGRRGSYTVPRGFYGVPDAKRVEEAILELRNSAADG